MFFQNLKQLLENCLKILVVSHLFWWWSDFLEATHGIPKELPFPVPFRRRHVAHVRHDVGQDLQGRNLWFLFLGVEGNGGEHLQREGMNFSTVKRWRQDSLNDQTKQCQKLWPKPFKNTINLHHVCSRGCTLYTPRFFIMTPPPLSATSPSTTPSSFVVPSQQSAPACVRWWGHRPILWALTDDPTTPQGSDSAENPVCSGVDVFWLNNLNGFPKNMLCCIRLQRSLSYISFRFSYDECIGFKFDMTCYSHRSLTIHPLKA